MVEGIPSVNFCILTAGTCSCKNTQTCMVQGQQFSTQHLPTEVNWNLSLAEPGGVPNQVSTIQVGRRIAGLNVRLVIFVWRRCFFNGLLNVVIFFILVLGCWLSMAAVDSFHLLYQEVARSCHNHIEFLAVVGAVYTARNGLSILYGCCSVLRHVTQHVFRRRDLILEYGQWAVVTGKWRY